MEISANNQNIQNFAIFQRFPKTTNFSFILLYKIDYDSAILTSWLLCCITENNMLKIQKNTHLQVHQAIRVPRNP